VNLPNAHLAVVDLRKIEDYLLSMEHPEGSAKASFFTSFGFDANRWQELAQALQQHATAHSISFRTATSHGEKFVVDGPLDCPDGRSPRIRVIWIVDVGSIAPRLVTAYPLQ
jgi:hypothetical protein